MSKLSKLARQICKNPADPTAGLGRKKDGRYQIGRMVGGKLQNFTDADPIQVWEKYAQALATAEAEARLSASQQAELEEARDRGPYFEEVAKRYQAEVELMKNGTQRSYLPAIKRATNHFAGRRMKDIAPWEIKSFLKDLGLAKTTTSNQKAVIGSVYQLWIDDPEWHGDYNPVAMTTLPRGLAQGRRTPPTEEQIAIVKNAAENPDVDDLIPILYLCTGGRRGEGCALRLQDILWDEGIIKITRAVEWPHNQPELKSTKTDAGVRKLPLLQLLVDALTSYRDLPQDTYIIGLGEKPVTARWYNNHWASFWKKHGYAHCVKRTYSSVKDGKLKQTVRSEWIADVCAHQFRHEYVCMLARAGVKEEYAIQIVGHANAKMVHEVYMHIDAEMLRETAKLMNASMLKTAETDLDI